MQDLARSGQTPISHDPEARWGVYVPHGSRLPRKLSCSPRTHPQAPCGPLLLHVIYSFSLFCCSLFAYTLFFLSLSPLLDQERLRGRVYGCSSLCPQYSGKIGAANWANFGLGTGGPPKHIIPVERFLFQEEFLDFPLSHIYQETLCAPVTFHLAHVISMNILKNPQGKGTCPFFLFSQCLK